MGNHDKMMLDVIDYQGDSDEVCQDNIDEWYMRITLISQLFVGIS